MKKVIILNTDVPITERLYFRDIGGVLWYTSRTALVSSEWAQLLIAIYGGYVAGD